MRYDPTRAFGLRGSVSTGFRAPSVQQKFYSSVSTNLNAAGVLTETLTAREGSAVTRAFGIAPLKEETSKSASVGMVLRPAANFSVTADLYRIDIDDRIVFSSNIAPESGRLPHRAPARSAPSSIRCGRPGAVLHQRDRHQHHGLDIVAEHTTRWPRFDAGAVRASSVSTDRGQGAPLAVAGAERRPAVRRRPGDADRTRPAAPAPRGGGRLHDGAMEREHPRQLLSAKCRARALRALHPDLGSEVAGRPERCAMRSPSA
jgi:outer membrane receptor protein involved in Fe transport